MKEDNMETKIQELNLKALFLGSKGENDQVQICV